MDTSRIFEMATDFRAAIESIPFEERPYSMQSFPNCSCGDTSRLFGAFLVDCAIPGFQFISGERGSKAGNTWASHAWLQHNDLVVDLTADQFSDAPSGVIVSAPSPWHEQFQTETGTDPDFRQSSDYGAELLYSIYEKVLRSIQQKNRA